MNLSQTNQFKKDIRRQIKKGKNPKKLATVVERLLGGETLPPKHQDHPLKGSWVGRRDCHIEPYWILIHKVSEDELLLERTGSHSDLF